VSQSARTHLLRLVRGQKEKFFGWRLHLVCTPEGVPVRVSLLPGSLHDLTPIHELTVELLAGARVFGDKGSNSATDEASILKATKVRLLPVHRASMKPHAWFVDDLELREYRHTIETVNSQCEAMGLHRLHARTNARFDIKVYASLVALQVCNAHEQSR
jgi:hypothetical protein